MRTSQKSKCQIKCLNCKGCFSSPIQFEDSESFFTSYLMDCSIRCPYCKQITIVNNDNIFFDVEMVRKEAKEKMLRKIKYFFKDFIVLIILVIWFLISIYFISRIP